LQKEEGKTVPTQCRQQVVCVLAVCNGECRIDVFEEAVVNVTEYFLWMCAWSKNGVVAVRAWSSTERHEGCLFDSSWSPVTSLSI